MKFLKRDFLPLLAFGIPTLVVASGLDVPYQSAAQLGNGLAGGAAIAEDASTNYFNPAGLVRIGHQQLVISAIAAESNYKYMGSMINPGFGSFVFERGKASTSPRGLVPAFHYVNLLTPNIAFGMSMVIPAGFALNYPEGSIVRYEILKAVEKSVALSPSAAYQITPQFAVGVGFDALLVDAYFKTNIRTQPFTPTDSVSTNRASSWNYGWHAGLLYEPTPYTRFGVSYHSQIIARLNGGVSRIYTSDVFLPPQVRANNLRIKLPLASKTILSAYHDLNCQWAIMGTVEWMNWSIYKYDRSFGVASIPTPMDVILPKKLHNTWVYALGATYRPSYDWKIRAGVTYLQGATDTKNRSVTLPDPSQYAVDLGVHYQYCNYGWDFVLSQGILQTVNIRHTNPTTFNTLRGRIKQTGDAIGVQLTWDMV